MIIRTTERDPMVPPLQMLGVDLLWITPFQRTLTLAAPFLCVAAYFWCAANGWWFTAVLAVVSLSFVTYGSTSHDLVHGNLGLPRTTNDWFLSVVELLTLRSGHAYRLAHVHHHARYPHEDDIEGGAARMSWARALWEGPVLQVRIWLWALQRAKRDRIWVVMEGLGCLFLLGTAVVLWKITPIFLVYAALVVMGSWLFPLITATIPHDPEGKSVLFQTRVFRGVVLSVIACGHLYHMEHHLYPAVPHHNWPKLARRLDPYLEQAGVKSIKLWF